LTPEGSRLLGLANNAFLEGEIARAREILQSLIQQCPTASEPYQTIGMTYEDGGDLEKAMLFYMITAHLKPQDAELWRRLSDLCRYAIITKRIL
jgi:general transcription factor 3C polypeptide 3 (transcription factor C subunit 4)